jgi:basic membrane protein A and related proteins
VSIGSRTKPLRAATLLIVLLKPLLMTAATSTATRRDRRLLLELVHNRGVAIMVKQYRRRQLLVYGTTALGSSIFLKACAAPTPTDSPSASVATENSSPAATNFKVAIVLPGPITDKGWNQAGFESMAIIKTKLGAETAYVEKVAQADQTEILSDFARRGFNLIVAHGGQFEAAVKQVAAPFPKTCK